MKKTFIVLGLFFLAFTVRGQSLSPTVIASAGDYFENGDVSLSFTVGEVAVTTLQAGDVILTQGFQQPFELDVTGVKDQEISWSVKAYPNPVKEMLHVRFTLEKPQDFTVMLLDITGKKLLVKEYSGVQPSEVKEISFGDYAPGVYFLSIISKDKTVRRIYKIQKVK